MELFLGCASRRHATWRLGDTFEEMTDTVSKGGVGPHGDKGNSLEILRELVPTKPIPAVSLTITTLQIKRGEPTRLFYQAILPKLPRDLVDNLLGRLPPSRPDPYERATSVSLVILARDRHNPDVRPVGINRLTNTRD